MIRLITIVLLLSFFPLVCHGADTDPEKVAAVAVKGNRRIETAAILNVVKTKAGDYLSVEKVDDDIRAIYRLGHFDDVQATTEKGDKGVVLQFVVVEKPIVREIKFEGNKQLSADKLREAVELKPNTVFSAKELTKSIRKVKKLYADDGYYLAEVEATPEKRGAHDVRVVFRIVEGKKVLIEKIRFEGNKAFTDRQLKKVMETSEAWFLSWLTNAGTYKEEVLKNDVNLISDHYFNNGYINVKVGEPKVTVLDNKEGLVVGIGISEGDQFRIGAIDVKGDLLLPREELTKKVTLKKGEIFSRADLRAQVFTLTDLYADEGYAFANVNPVSRVNPENRTVDLMFDFEKGEKVRIDRIGVSGNTKTRDKVVRREMKLAEGDLYSTTALKKSRQNLMNLGYFEEVNLATSKGSTPDRLNINVEVKEKPTGTFSIGAGYSSLDGVIGQGSVQQANFLGLGLKANLAASIGGKSQTYNVGVTDPYFLDTRWTVGGDIYRTERDYVDYTRRATGGDIKAGYPLSDILSTFWVYKFEDKKVFNESAALLAAVKQGLVVAPESSSTTSSVTASLARNTTDYRLDPTTGMINNVSAEVAGLGGTNRFVKYIGNTTWFHPLIGSSVFSLRGEVGYIQDLGSVPIDEKFYLGGINTVRGYNGRTVSPYQTVTVNNNMTGVGGIGSQAISRAYLGGNAEAFANAEVHFPLLKEAGLKGLVFFDAGTSYDTKLADFTLVLSNGKWTSVPTHATQGKVQTSYGVGIRWFSPIGPLRLEYGIPLNPRQGIDNSGGRLEFSIGSFF